MFRTDIRNVKQELPIHIAARNDKCHTQVIQLLSQDFPRCFAMASRDGSLPIHTACQRTKDTTLIATLLYYNRSVVNVPRGDGFTPLHLICARHDINDPSIGLIPLDEDTQVRMIKVLLDHGADKTMRVENYLPGNLLKKDRTKVAHLLKLRRGEGSRQNSPTSASPPTSGSPNNGFVNGGGYYPPQTGLNNLNAGSGGIPQSPAASSGFGDMSSPGSFASAHSPPHSMDLATGYQSQNSPYGTGVYTDKLIWPNFS